MVNSAATSCRSSARLLRKTNVRSDRTSRHTCSISWTSGCLLATHGTQFHYRHRDQHQPRYSGSAAKKKPARQGAKQAFQLLLTTAGGNRGVVGRAIETL